MVLRVGRCIVSLLDSGSDLMFVVMERVTETPRETQPFILVSVNSTTADYLYCITAVCLSSRKKGGHAERKGKTSTPNIKEKQRCVYI